MTHGPLVGAVTAQRATIWLRTNEAARVKIEYAPQAKSNANQFSRETETASDSDFTAQLELENLTTQTIYTVRVYVDGQVQMQGGRFKTFPDPNVSAPFKMVVLTDFSYSVTPAANRTFQLADAENPDFVFIGGDFDHRDPKLLPEKRQMFRDWYSDDPTSLGADFAKFILHRYALGHQWDDHDYGGDNSDRTAAWRETALQVFREYFPAYPLGKYGIYQSFRYGKDVEVFILDGRSQRDPNQAPDDENKSMLNGEHHADGQVQWLLDGLKNSNATWKLVMSPSGWNETMLKSDSWANFSYERKTILNFIREHKIGGVMMIAGDLHGGALDNGENAGVPSVVVPSANLPTCFSVPEAKLGKWSNGIYGDATRANNNVSCNGYAVVSINAAQAHIEIKDGAGNIPLKMELDPRASLAVTP